MWGRFPVIALLLLGICSHLLMGNHGITSSRAAGGSKGQKKKPSDDPPAPLPRLTVERWGRRGVDRIEGAARRKKNKGKQSTKKAGTEL